MPPLNVKISGDATQFAKELKRAEMLSSKFAADMSRRITSSGSGVLSQSRAAQVANEIAIQKGVQSGFTTGGVSGGSGAGVAKGRRPGFAVAASMFTSVARDSAASLASGAPITQVIAQQAPQVLQALSMMRLGWVGIGIAASAAAVGGIYLAMKSMKDFYFEANRTKELDDKLAAFNKRIIDTAHYLNNLGSLIDNAWGDKASKVDEFTKAQEDALDAAAELEKQQIRAQARTGRFGVNPNKKDIDRAELEVDLKRAKAKEKSVKDAVESGQFGSAEINAGEAKLKDAANATAGSKSEDEALANKYAEEAASRNLAHVKSLVEKKKQGALSSAEANVLSIKEKIESLYDAPEKKPTTPSNDSRQNTPDVNAMQRSGHWAVGNSPLLDVNKAQLKSLQMIEAWTKTQKGKSGNFG